MPRPGPAFALLVLLAAPALAQDDIEPDRPSVSTSTRTVPVRAVQLEAGMEYSQASDGPSASLAGRVLGRLTVFAELFFASRDEHDGRDGLGADAGLGILVTRALALDGAVETTLTGDGPDYAVRAGLSVRFGSR